MVGGYFMTIYSPIFYLVVYVLLLAYLMFKLNDILKNPKKYQSIPGYYEYQRSIYYWNSTRNYSKGDLPETVLPTFFGLYFIIPYWWYHSLIHIHTYESKDSIESFACIHPIWLVAFVICSILLAVTVSSYLSLFSTKPRDICFSLFQMQRIQHKKHLQRHELWKKWTIYMIVVVIASGSIRLITSESGGSFEEDKLLYAESFGRVRQEFLFEEISVETEYDEETGEIAHYYLVNPSGDRFDLCDPNIQYLDESNFDAIAFVQAKIETREGT